MIERKAVSNSFYAVLVSLSLVAGMTALSLVQPSQEVSTPGDFRAPDIPGNYSVNAPSPNTSIDVPRNSSIDRPIRSGNVPAGFISDIARGLFELFSGRNIQRPRFSGGDTSMPDVNTTEGNTTESDPLNETDPEDPSNSTGSPERPQSEGENGFLKDLLKQFMGLLDFEGSESQERNQSETSPEDPKPDPVGPEEPQDPENPAEGDDKKNSDGENSESSGSGLPEIPDKVLYGLLVSFVLGAVLIGKRSDVDVLAVLKKSLERIREFVLSMPDLFRRLAVKTASFISDTASKILVFVLKLSRKPLKTLRAVKDEIFGFFSDIKKRSDKIKDRGLSGSVASMLPGENAPEKGLSAVWYLLRKKAGVKNRKNLTPKEIGEEARRKEINPVTVDEIVEAYRWENYSPEGYKDEQRIEEWMDELGDEDE